MTTLLSDTLLFGTTIHTRDGRALPVRPVQPDDEEALVALFAGLSPDQLRFRFLSPLRVVPERQLADLIAVDHRNREHLLAFGDDDRVVASALIARDPSGRAAEVAIAVAQAHRGQGIGTAMLRAVMTWARAAGIARLYTVEAHDNRDAIMVERELGFTSRLLDGDPGLLLLEAQL